MDFALKDQLRISPPTILKTVSYLHYSFGYPESHSMLITVLLNVQSEGYWKLRDFYRKRPKHRLSPQWSLNSERRFLDANS